MVRDGVATVSNGTDLAACDESDAADTQPLAEEAAVVTPTREVRTISPSSCGDFQRCPQLFKYRHDQPTPDMVRGTALHAVLNDLYELPRANRTVEAVQDAFRAMWARERAAQWNAHLFAEPSAEREWGLKALQLLENYFYLEEPAAQDPLWREKRLHVEFGDAGGAPSVAMNVTGILDRLDRGADGQLAVVDYKTGKAPTLKYSPAVNERIIREKFQQLKIYALLAQRVHGEMPRRLVLLYLDGPARLTMEVEPSILDETERELWQTWHDIQRALATQHFPPRTSRLCDWCSFKPICPAFKS
ncbi:RecB family exonuclease [Tribonema minus]|uniref:RecB family exonuclease n=1 Tax=Tribonema minus TaxID=303371 RepID=A0A835YV45_9STRA|nr:RecB family exonuclease [Tribonema minus]